VWFIATLTAVFSLFVFLFSKKLSLCLSKKNGIVFIGCQKVAFEKGSVEHSH